MKSWISFLYFVGKWLNFKEPDLKLVFLLLANLQLHMDFTSYYEHIRRDQVVSLSLSFIGPNIGPC